ncbi:MAG: UDP-N-acetylmuramate dehydrogenase [Muribaculaceae bacterium]|nr:UDP-N-acetylmuramate dehydrogenase [Muribaculaceae bacterium]
MVTFEEYKDLTSLTTFGVPVKARWYAEYASEKELLKITRDGRFIDNQVYYIGGGSNLLFLHDFDGLVLRSAIKGIVRYDKDPQTCYVIAGAGEKWSDLVEWTVNNEIAGLENMAAIPGDVGAAPVQNVGAYGVEAKDVVFSVECFDTMTRKTVRFSAEECGFGYRDSMFKHEGKGRYIVLRVSFRLSQTTKPSNLSYGPLKEFAKNLGHEPTIREIADEIKRIRDSKLPDPDKLGSAGSFFKNPVVHNGFLKEIEVLTGQRIQGHPVGEHHTKVSAAWLIDNAGMKGMRCGGAMVYEKQPLVIVNTGHATAEDVKLLAEKVRSEVRNKFLIDLNPEVNYIDTTINVTLLGTGTSKGIPEIGCMCRVCQSPYLKDKRTRTSALVRTMGMTLLIDPSPDFRQQALREGLHHIDAVLVTHGHNDHVGGLDDLRPFCADHRLTVYTDPITDKELRTHFEYCFREHPYPGVPTFDMHVIDKNPFFINGVKIIPIEVMHGQRPILGYRIGKFAYITDAKTIAPEELEKLEGVDTMVLNALRDRDHFSHFTLEEALEVINEINPRQAYLTHFNHEIGRHHELASRLPENVAPGYDGLTFNVR